MDGYALHKCVFENNPEKLKQVLTDPTNHKPNYDINERFRLLPPLHLAIQLGYHECTTILLDHGADPLIRNGLGFHALHEAFSIGHRKTIEQMIKAQRKTLLAISKQHQTTDVKDFYVEINVDCACSIPFVSRFLPSDRFKVWKVGNHLRMDYTLAGMDGMRLIRAPVSLIVEGLLEAEGKVTMVNHDLKIYEEHLVADSENSPKSTEENSDLDHLMYIHYKMNNPIRCGQFDSKAVNFVKAKKGLLFRQDWIENIGTRKDTMEPLYRDCQVYNIKGLEVTRKERLEHLSEARIIDLQKSSNNHDMTSSPMDLKNLETSDIMESFVRENAHITAERYFNLDEKEKYLHMGRTLKIKEKKFSISSGAKVWMAPEAPISISDLLPLLQTLMITNEAVEKLNFFTESKLPPGFPVKIQVPFFTVLTVTLEIGQVSLSPRVDDGFFECPKEGKGYKKGTVGFIGDGSSSPSS